MPDRMKISKDVTLGAQPSEAELHEMAAEGVKSVINLRTDDEDMQPIKPDAEGGIVRGLGMTYAHVPVSMKDAGPAVVEAFCRELAAAPKPAFVHCKLGQRAGAMVLIDTAIRNGWSSDEAFRHAGEMEFVCDNQKLTDFIRRSIDHRNAASQ